MIPARGPRPAAEHRLMHIDPAGQVVSGDLRDLGRVLRAGDVVVVNDAATVPASLQGRVGEHRVELRLAGHVRDAIWRAVSFGAGSWRDDTDRRPAPPALHAGDEVVLRGGLRATVAAVDVHTPRLLTVRFDRDGPALWEALYAAGRPVQYSYAADDLPLAAVQTPLAGSPWAVEMPSAGRPLTLEGLVSLRRRGVQLAALTHAAGLSATGDPALDARLPLPERYRIPPRTAALVNGAEGRVVAVGTSVVRALESAVDADGRVQAGEAVTERIIEAHTELRVVDGLLSGLHEPSESHFRMHLAFAPCDVLLRAHAQAARAGYRNHEFGDSVLVLAA